jgi:hypothetical protein
MLRKALSVKGVSRPVFLIEVCESLLGRGHQFEHGGVGGEFD